MASLLGAVGRWLAGDFNWLYLAAFMGPLVELTMLFAGLIGFHACFRVAPKDTFSKMIIQITTLGTENQRVGKIISLIRSYELPFDHEIWVVIEPPEKLKPSQRQHYNANHPNADKVLVVPANFASVARAKGRALSWSAMLRKNLGLNTRDTKVYYLDDDVDPTRNNLIGSFMADYDICQGVTAPSVQYGGHGGKHWFLSHMDDMRFLACLIWCSFTQGVIKHPVYAHGEGLCVTGWAEDIVGWERATWASEDLSFGTTAVKMGMRWGWIHEYIEITSPWSLLDFFKQRRRWLWGNIDCIFKKGLMPTWARWFVALKYLLGFGMFFVSIIGAALLLTHYVRFTPMTYVFTWGAWVAWVFAFAVSGWVNSGRREDHVRGGAGFVLNRLWQSLVAVVLAVTLITPLWTTGILLLGLLAGRPGGFDVIAKTRDSSKRGGRLLRLVPDDEEEAAA